MSLKNYYNYQEFVRERNLAQAEDKVNEGIFDFFKKMANKLVELGKKVKHSAEIDKYIKTLKQEIETNGKAELDQKLQALKKGTPPAPAAPAPAPSAVTNNQAPTPSKETTKPVKENKKFTQLLEAAVAPAPAAPKAGEKVEGVKTTEDPFKDYFEQIMTTAGEELAKYLQSDNKSTQFYAKAKLAEIKRVLLNLKLNAAIALSKETATAELGKQLQQATQTEIKTTEQEIKTNVDATTKEIAPGPGTQAGEILSYTNKKGEVKNILMQADGSAIAVSDAEGNPLQVDELETKLKNKDTFKPLRDKTEAQKDQERLAKIRQNLGTLKKKMPDLEVKLGDEEPK